MIKAIIFDMDGTICPPGKQDIKPEMAELLQKLLGKYKVGVITGQSFEYINSQIIRYLGEDEKILSNFIPLPTIGGRMYQFENGTWNLLYNQDFSDEEKNKILSVLENAIDELGLRPEKTFGELVDDRDSMICYALLGQVAPPELKAQIDPDFTKRLKIIDFIKDELSQFDLAIGGSSSIDITRKGQDKAFGIRKFMEIFGVKKYELIFAGDRIIPNGNDYAPLENGFIVKKVDSLDDTADFINSLLN